MFLYVFTNSELLRYIILLAMTLGKPDCCMRTTSAQPQAGQHPCQGSHRLEKYLNIQDCCEKSLKIKFALKST